MQTMGYPGRGYSSFLSAGNFGVRITVGAPSRASCPTVPVRVFAHQTLSTLVPLPLGPSQTLPYVGSDIYPACLSSTTGTEVHVRPLVGGVPGQERWLIGGQSYPLCCLTEFSTWAGSI